MRITNKTRIILLMGFALLFILLTFFLVKAVFQPGSVEEKIVQYEYAQKANLDYQVFLKPNLLYEESVLGMGKIYPTNFVEQLQTSFTYEFRGSDEAEIKGNYDVVATVQGIQKEENKEKLLWSRDFLLVPQTPFQSSAGQIVLERVVPLALESFNQFANQVQKASEIFSDVNLVVAWRIKVEAENLIEEELTSQLTVPLCKKYFEVSGDLNVERPGVLEKTVATELPVNKTKVGLLGLSLLICLLALLYLVRFVEISALTSLEKQVKAIFKKHGERLVALDEEIIPSGDMLKIKAMDDLVRIADEICSPIYYYVQKVRGEEALSFFVFNEARVYTYGLGPTEIVAPVSEDGVLPYL